MRIHTKPKQGNKDEHTHPQNVKFRTKIKLKVAFKRYSVLKVYFRSTYGSERTEPGSEQNNDQQEPSSVFNKDPILSRSVPVGAERIKPEQKVLVSYDVQIFIVL